MRTLELLAPARNREIGIAAIDCGADAVYLAGPAFGARQAAGNSLEDIRELCEYAHRFGARVFVTLNTIIYDSELSDALSLAEKLQEAGADALIVQDMAIPAYSLSHPERLSIPLHASTQCSIRTMEEARRFAALGFSRIVLERELPFETVREICSGVECEVEAFVHGALCVCYSGQCYLSQMLSSRSANRGECVQACRSRYDLVDSEGKLLKWPESASTGAFAGSTGPFAGSVAPRPGRPVAENRTLLSLRDLRLLERLPEMARGGVSSFKIEGRLKSISYVRNIVAAYSRALDALVASAPGEFTRASFGRAVCAFTPNPVKSFNRGFTEVFFDGKRGRWACLDAGKALGEAVGTVGEVSRTRGGGMRIKVLPLPGKDSPSLTHKGFGRADAALRKPHNGDTLPELHNGDGFAFLGPDGTETGFRADVCEGQFIHCREVPGLSKGTVLYRNLDTAFEKEVERGGVRRIAARASVRIEDCGKEGGVSGVEGGLGCNASRYRIILSARSEDGREVQAEAVIDSEPARNRERMMEGIRSQLCKTSGIYSFSLEGDSESTNCELNRGSVAGEGIIIDGDIPMIPSSVLNALRREAAEKLDSMQCIAKPLLKAKIKGELPEDLKFPAKITYKSDVANECAAAFYRSLGAEEIEPAYELTSKGEKPEWGCASEKNGGIAVEPKELMRSKYCLLYELGLCRKTPAYAAFAAANYGLQKGLYLRNNGRLLRLGFDCAACEMTIQKND